MYFQPDGQSTLLDRVELRLQSRTTARDASVLQSRMSGLDLHPKSLPPAGILLVRRMRAPALQSCSGDAASADWERAARERVEQQLRHAATPLRGRLPVDAEAIRFADEAEMLACLAVDVAAGEAREKWWWRAVLRHLRGTPASALRELMRERIRAVPAMVAHLVEWRQLTPVLDLLSERDATDVLARLQRCYGSDTPRAMTAQQEFPSASQLEIATAHSPKWRVTSAALALLRSPSAVALNASARTQLRESGLMPSADTSRASTGATKTSRVPRAPPSQARETKPTPANTPPLDTRAAAFANTSEFVPDAETLEPAEQPIETGAKSRPDARQREDAPRAPKERSANPPMADTADRREAPRHATSNNHPGAATSQQDSDPPSFQGPLTTTPPSPATRNAEPPANAASVPPIASPEAPGTSRTSEPRQSREPLVTAADFTEPSLLAKQGIATEFGGCLFLVNLMTRLDLPQCFEQDLEFATHTGAWGVLETLSRGLLALIKHGVPEDPLWRLLAMLDGREAGTDPTDLATPPDFRGGTMANVDPIELPDTELLATLGPGLRTWLRWASAQAALDLRRQLRLPDRNEAIARVLLHPARIHATATHVDMVLDLDRADLAVRISGLDQDPGWRPEFRRVIQFYFR